MSIGKAIALLAPLVLGAGEAAAQATLAEVVKRGELRCGISEALPGYAMPDADGKWSGFNIDFCRAVAAAVLGDAEKVRYVPTTPKTRFTVLQSGEVDVLSRNTTATFVRMTELGLAFSGVFLYDGQGFLTRRKLGLKSAAELNGASICTNTGGTAELNLADFFRSRKIPYKAVVFERQQEVVAAYEAGRCDAMLADRSALASQRLKLKSPDEHVVLPDMISKEPIGPYVRQADQQWASVVRWVMNVPVAAEELGLTRANVEAEAKSSVNPEVKRMLGGEGKYGEMLGLRPSWAYDVVKQVGNYGEIYERHIGRDSPLKLDRGLNALWSDGGLMYAYPFR